MIRQSRKVLIFGMFLSAVVHALIYFFLYRTYSTARPLNTRKGVVSVEFVHSFSHKSVEEKGDRKKVEPQNSVAAVPQNVEPNLVGQKGVEGDPAAQARETDAFIATVTALIAQHKIYPSEAIAREEEGRVILGLTVERDGLISSVQIEQPSPFELLNEAAIRSIHKIQRFPPVPDLISVPLHLHVPLVFRLETR